MYTETAPRSVTPIEVLITLFLIAFIFMVTAYIFATFLGILPAGLGKQISSFVYNTSYGFIDKSIIFIVLIMLIIDAINSWQNPTVFKAVLNLIGIFFIGFINLAFVTTFAPVMVTINGINALPLTYNFVTSPAYSSIFLIFMAISVIFNIRGVSMGRTPPINTQMIP